MERERSADGEIRRELEEQFDVQIESSVEQTVEPSDLEPTGQVLLMERSYGGSHNPRETELTGDLVRSTALQLGVGCCRVCPCICIFRRMRAEVGWRPASRGHDRDPFACDKRLHSSVRPWR